MSFLIDFNLFIMVFFAIYFVGLIIMKDKNLLYTVSTEVVVDCPMKFR